MSPALTWIHSIMLAASAHLLHLVWVAGLQVEEHGDQELQSTA